MLQTALSTQLSLRRVNTIGLDGICSREDLFSLPLHEVEAHFPAVMPLVLLVYALHEGL